MMYFSDIVVHISLICEQYFSVSIDCISQVIELHILALAISLYQIFQYISIH